jgi:hypothetical protein
LNEFPIGRKGHTEQDGWEEEINGNVDDGRHHVHEPIWRHRKESKKKEEEEETIIVFVHLNGNENNEQ